MIEAIWKMRSRLPGTGAAKVFPNARTRKLEALSVRHFNNPGKPESTRSFSSQHHLYMPWIHQSLARGNNFPSVHLRIGNVLAVLSICF